jgi:transcriptional regulator with XRE-family HTH domain
MIIAARMRDARKAAGLMQADLAAAMGERYDAALISRAERGLSSLRLDGLATAARVLGVSVDYLLGLTDDPAPAAVLAERAKAALAERAKVAPPKAALADPASDSRKMDQSPDGPPPASGFDLSGLTLAELTLAERKTLAIARGLRDSLLRGWLQVGEGLLALQPGRGGETPAVQSPTLGESAESVEPSDPSS